MENIDSTAADQETFVLSLCDLSLYDRESLELMTKPKPRAFTCKVVKTIECFEELIGWNGIVEVYANQCGIPKSAKCIELILPPTEAPSRYPHTECKPGLVHFSVWLRQFFVYFDELEFFKLTNLWPLSFQDLFHAFTIFSTIYEETGQRLSPNLSLMDLGSIGFHAWNEEAFQFFASDVFSHVSRISFTDRCGVQQYWEGEHCVICVDMYKYLDFMGNVYWDGVPATEWVISWEKNRMAYGPIH